VLALPAGVASSAQAIPAYDTLTDTQKRLLGGLAPRPGAEQASQARANFDGAATSVRAAFIEVTSALEAVSLSDHENGEILGVALDLVDRVELLELRPVGEADDRAARLRVTLASGATDRLRRSSEFTRAPSASAQADAIVYRHEGPPSIKLIITSLTATILVR